LDTDEVSIPLPSKLTTISFVVWEYDKLGSRQAPRNTKATTRRMEVLIRFLHDTSQHFLHSLKRGNCVLPCNEIVVFVLKETAEKTIRYSYEDSTLLISKKKVVFLAPNLWHELDASLKNKQPRCKKHLPGDEPS
jgi:hypothetical protein